MISVIKCDRKTAAKACWLYHYALYLPSGIIICYSIYEDKVWIGALIFTSGPRLLGTRYGIDTKDKMELSRVALGKHNSHVTHIISKVIKQLKLDIPKCKVLFSYADPNYNHIGIIYQAGNWYFLGQSRSRPLIYINGLLVHARTLNHWYGTSNLTYLSTVVPNMTVVKNLKPKYLYAYPLNKEIRKRLKGYSLPYIKM